MKIKDWKELSKRDPHEVATHEDIEKLRKEERGLGKTLIGAGAINYAIGVGAKKVYNNPDSSLEAKAKIDSRKVHREIRSGYAEKNIRGAKRTGVVMTASGAALIGYTHYKHYKDKKREATEKTFADAFTGERLAVSKENLQLRRMQDRRATIRLQVQRIRTAQTASLRKHLDSNKAIRSVANDSSDSESRRSTAANQFALHSKPTLKPSKTVSMK